jgi:hypothetical protein
VDFLLCSKWKFQENFYAESCSKIVSQDNHMFKALKGGFLVETVSKISVRRDISTLSVS